MAAASGQKTTEEVYRVSNGTFVAAPINLTGCTEAVLVLYATGMDNVSASDVQAKLKAVSGTVLYAGPQGSFIGVDQINVEIPLSLAGSGNIPVVLTAQGQTSNTVNITIQ